MTRTPALRLAALSGLAWAALGAAWEALEAQAEASVFQGWGWVGCREISISACLGGTGSYRLRARWCSAV